jgi:glutamate-5-semialdehyde dehydrogenase
MQEFLQKAKDSAAVMNALSDGVKKDILKQMADALVANKERIIEKNAIDMQNAKQNNLSAALVDRLLLDSGRIDAMAKSLEEIAALKDPVGRIKDGWTLENGLRLQKVSVPIGVIGIIYESRPNVTSDAAALCFKSGNVAVLKGGKEAQHSNEIIASILQEVLEKNNLPKSCIALLPDSSREGVATFIKQDRFVDLIIPRGGEALIRFVNENATVPVVKHDKGLCHTYIDKDANLDDAVAIAVNAKCQRTGVCNAMETLLVDESVAQEILPQLKQAYDAHETKLLGCEKTRAIIDVGVASDEDYATEYLDNILSIKTVAGVKEAMAHIAKYGSSHSEAIITQNYETAETFLNGVDAACVYLNASTRFTDGAVFGLGAEVGISTNKLHARGPMGIDDLTTFKFKIYGSGQIR